MTPHLLWSFKSVPSQFTLYVLVGHGHDWFGQIKLKIDILQGYSKYDIIFTQVTLKKWLFLSYPVPFVKESPLYCFRTHVV